MGIDGRGIGCFAIHYSRDFVAVGEKGTMPNIYIYEYPSFRVVKVRVNFNRSIYCTCIAYISSRRTLSESTVNYFRRRSTEVEFSQC